MTHERDSALKAMAGSVDELLALVAERRPFKGEVVEIRIERDKLFAAFSSGATYAAYFRHRLQG